MKRLSKFFIYPFLILLLSTTFVYPRARRGRRRGGRPAGARSWSRGRSSRGARRGRVVGHHRRPRRRYNSGWGWWPWLATTAVIYNSSSWQEKAEYWERRARLLEREVKWSKEKEERLENIIKDREETIRRREEEISDLKRGK